MQLDANTLPVDVRMTEISDHIAIRATRAVSPRSPIRKLATRGKLLEGNLYELFVKIKHVEGIDDDKY